MNGDFPLSLCGDFTGACWLGLVFGFVEESSFLVERFELGEKSRLALFATETGVVVTDFFAGLSPNTPFFENFPSFFENIPSFLVDTFLSVTSNPSWIIAPGTGRRGPTYLKKVSSTDLFRGVFDTIAATSSIVARAEFFPFSAAS